MVLGHTQTQIDHTREWVDISVAMVFIAGCSCWVVGKSGGLVCTVMACACGKGRERVM